MTAATLRSLTTTHSDDHDGAADPPLWLVGLDLASVLLFAVEGGLMAVSAGFALVGILAVAFLSALGGGLIRDLLVQRHPPAALGSVAYPAVALAGGLLAAFGHDALAALMPGMRMPLDAVGLGMMCGIGAVVALGRHMSSLGAILLGTISAVGGGVIRDIMTGDVPMVMRHDTAAVAAAAGATVTVVTMRLGVRSQVAAVLGATTCVGLSLAATYLGWRLPGLTA
ncbi:MAG: trimeric intracellular cation channel family protein [Pseudonocardiaceae bacterium]|nr:MAG: trimeric intracellular cation channel family protein [Pseudonocardiaceae bacterium]